MLMESAIYRDLSEPCLLTVRMRTDDLPRELFRGVITFDRVQVEAEQNM